jgi:hypothetical protein
VGAGSLSSGNTLASGVEYPAIGVHLTNQAAGFNSVGVTANGVYPSVGCSIFD